MKFIILIYLIFFIQCNSSKKSDNTLAIALLGTKSSGTTTQENKQNETEKPKTSSACGNSLQNNLQEINTIQKSTATIICLNTSTYSTKNFWAKDDKSDDYTKSTFEQKCQTSNYNIWLKKGQNLPTGVTMDEYINELENKIHPALLSYIGKPLDINNNKRVDIVIAKTKSNIGGYVRDDSTGDYSSSSQSNQADILYLNNGITKELFYSTTAHELQHLVRVRYMYDSTTKTITKDAPWINEGAAEYIADKVYGIQSYRFEYFKKTPKLFIPISTNGASVFHQTTQHPIYYAMTYVFSTYIYENSGTTAQDKKDFVYKVTSGLDRSGNKLSTGRCGNTANKFFEFFKQAKTYDSSILGTTSQDIFKNLYGGFLYQTSYLNLDGTTINNIYDSKSKISTDYFKQIVQKYQLPDHFKSQFNSSSLNDDNYFSNSSSQSRMKDNDDSSGYHYFFKGHYSSLNMGNTQILIQYTRNGSQYSLLYDYSMNKGTAIIPNIVHKVH